MENQDVIGAFEVLRNWYRKFTGRALKPSEPEMEETRKAYSELFADDELSDDLPYEFDY